MEFGLFWCGVWGFVGFLFFLVFIVLVVINLVVLLLDVGMKSLFIGVVLGDDVNELFCIFVMGFFFKGFCFFILLRCGCFEGGVSFFLIIFLEEKFFIWIIIVGFLMGFCKFLVFFVMVDLFIKCEVNRLFDWRFFFVLESMLFFCFFVDFECWLFLRLVGLESKVLLNLLFFFLVGFWFVLFWILEFILWGILEEWLCCFLIGLNEDINIGVNYWLWDWCIENN